MTAAETLYLAASLYDDTTYRTRPAADRDADLRPLSAALSALSRANRLTVAAAFLGGRCRDNPGRRMLQRIIDRRDSYRRIDLSAAVGRDLWADKPTI